MGVEEFKTALSGDLTQFAENTFRLQSGTYALGDAPLALNGSAEGALLRISGGFSPTGGVTSDPTVFSGDNAHGYSLSAEKSMYYSPDVLCRTLHAV